MFLQQENRVPLPIGVRLVEEQGFYQLFWVAPELDMEFWIGTAGYNPYGWYGINHTQSYKVDRCKDLSEVAQKLYFDFAKIEVDEENGEGSVNWRTVSYSFKYVGEGYVYTDAPNNYTSRYTRYGKAIIQYFRVKYGMPVMVVSR